MDDPVRDELVPAATTDPRHDLAIQALLAGASVQEAADAAGVSRATLWRWRTHDRDFAGRLAEQRAALLEAVIDAMTTEALAAVETLSEIHRDPMQPGAVRVQAVQALLGKLLTSHAR